MRRGPVCAFRKRDGAGDLCAEGEFCVFFHFGEQQRDDLKKGNKKKLTFHVKKTQQFDFALAEGAPPVGMTTGATIHTSSGLMLRLTKRKHDGASGGGETRGEVVAETAVVV